MKPTYHHPARLTAAGFLGEHLKNMKDSFIFVLSNEWGIEYNRHNHLGMHGDFIASYLISTTYQWWDTKGVFHEETRFPEDAPIKFFPYNPLTLEPL